MRIGRCQIIGFCAVLFAASFAQAQEQRDWAQRMFSELEHDFGNVASGADTRHHIQVKNIYQEQVRILNVGTKIGRAHV